jgi:hypothetical protein
MRRITCSGYFTCVAAQAGFIYLAFLVNAYARNIVCARASAGPHMLASCCTRRRRLSMRWHTALRIDSDFIGKEGCIYCLG